MNYVFDRERIDGALTSVYRELVFLTPETTPLTLVAALQAHLPHIDPLSWGTRLARGGTYLNGVCTEQDCRLQAPCRIEYYEPKEERDHDFIELRNSMRKRVVYEDDEILVVYKPRGLSTMPTREQRHLNLKAFLLHYLAETSPGASLHLPSRVDTSVEGLVVASKAQRMHAPLQRMFEKRLIKKYYRLESVGCFEGDTLTADRSIDRDDRHPVLRRVVLSGGKPALTHFKVLERRPAGRILIEAQPITGRTHQIRVHAASYGFPIVGDNFYGGIAAEALHLASFRAQFTHPHRHVPLEIVAPDALMPDWLSSAPFGAQDQGGGKSQASAHV